MASSTSSPALGGQNRYREIRTQILHSACGASRRYNFSESFCMRIHTKPRVIVTIAVPTQVLGVLHALGIVRHLHNQFEISILGI